MTAFRRIPWVLELYFVTLKSQVTLNNVIKPLLDVTSTSSKNSEYNSAPPRFVHILSVKNDHIALSKRDISMRYDFLLLVEAKVYCTTYTNYNSCRQLNSIVHIHNLRASLSEAVSCNE